MNNKHLVIPLGLLAITAISGMFLISSNSSADDSGVDNVSITIPVTCTMVGTGMNSHTATIENGTYRGDDVNGIGIGETTLKAYCNDTSGFSIYAIGYTNEEYGNTVLKSATLGDTYNIITGTNTGPVGSTDISNWSMKLKAVSGTYTPTIENGYSNYSNVPTTYTKVATKSSGTDMGSNAEGSSIKSTYAAYISKTQPSDTYEGKVKYTLVHPADKDPVTPLTPLDCLSGSICYAPNANDIEGSMSSIGTLPTVATGGKQSVTANSETTLISANYKRSGYGLAGWSTSYNASPGTDTIYGPNETISTDPSNGGVDISTNGLILYPVWIASAGNIQRWAGCNAMNIGAVTALRDLRDENVYTVAKLADGNCWMTENLRLDAENSTNASLAEGYGADFVGLPSSEDTNITSDNAGNTANNLYNTGNWQTMPRYNNNNTKIGGKNSVGTDLTPSYDANNDHVQWYSYGNYYTWAAAIADTTAHNSNNETVSGTSLCPAGWYLPTSGDKTNAVNNNFFKLGVALTGAEPANMSSSTYPSYQGSPEGTNASKAYRSFPNNFLYSGYFVGSSTGYRNNYAYYWSRSAGNIYNVYNLLFSFNYLNPSNHSFNKANGFSIRCMTGS